MQITNTSQSGQNPAAARPTLQPQLLTAGGFAPFGTVVEPFAPPGSPDALPPQGARAINSGTTWRLDVVHDLGLNHEGGTPGLAVYSASARQFPIRLEVLERHQLGSQSFLPLTGARFIVVVAAAGPAPGAAELKAFYTTGRQGVVLHRGTWHHALLAVEPGSFAVIERHQSSHESAVDCEVAALPSPVWLELPGAQDGATKD